MDPLDYVTAVAPLVGLNLPPDKLNDLAEAFALVMRLSTPALECQVDPETQPAPIFVA